MIVVTVDLWPRGAESRKREIGRMYIANVGGDHTRGDYQVAVCRRGTTSVPHPIDIDGPKATRAGKVTGYPRLAYNMWRLITRALKSAFPEESRGDAIPLDPAEDTVDGERQRLEDDLSEARAIARVLAHAYTTDNRPPQAMVDKALAYPVDLLAEIVGERPPSFSRLVEEAEARRVCLSCRSQPNDPGPCDCAHAPCVHDLKALAYPVRPK